MNKIINKFLIARDKFMPEMHLRQPGFTYSASGPFTKNKERIKEIRYIYQSKLDKVYFQHDIANGGTKDLPRRIIPNKALRDKAFNIGKIPKYDEYQRGIASMVYKFL